MEPEGLTPIQQRMFQVLSDGRLHSIKELHACLNDELGPVSNVYAHLTGMRKKLRPKGMDVMADRSSNSETCYRLIRLLASAVDGKR